MPCEEKPHREMVDFVSDPLSSHKLCLVPRGCWKTSLNSAAFGLWKSMRAYFLDGNPCFRVLIDSNTMSLSKDVLSVIIGWVKHHDTFKATFGEFYDRKGDKDGALSFNFRLKAATGIKEPNFKASGVNAEKTGGHYELLLLDDLVTELNYRSPMSRDKVFKHYQLLNAIMEEGEKEEKIPSEMVISGTRWHDDDMYGRILKQDKKALAEGEVPIFSVLLRQAVDAETGEYFYPSKLGPNVLERKKVKLKTLFWAQYMNDPNQESAPFKPEWLKWKSLISFPKLQYLRLTADLALKTDEADRGDYTAMVVMGWDQFHWPYVVDVTMKDNMTPGGFINEFFRLCMAWNLKSAIIEADHQESLEHLLRLEMHKRGFFVNIRWEKASRSYGKMSRWAEIQPYAERGGVHIAEEIPSDVRIEVQDQWERAPVASHDDFMDALSLQMLYLPIEFEKDGGRLVTGSGVEPAQIAAVAKEQQAQAFSFGTLAQSFPHIKALQKREEGEEDFDSDDTVQDEIYQTMMETFSGGVDATR